MIMNEILLDDDFWGQFYEVIIPDGGTLTAEWGNGRVEKAAGKIFWFDKRYGIDNIYNHKIRHNTVRLSTEAPSGITAFGLMASWSYGFYDRGKVSIDTSLCPSLERLCCAKIQSIDLSRNINLKSLGIWYSGLQALDLSNNCKLRTLEIFKCGNLKELDLRGCPGLKRLVLYSCPSLVSLLLSGDSELEYVSYNYHTAIAGESEDRLLATIERNGGSVEKTYLGV